VRTGGPSLWVSWLSTNTRASPLGRKPHGSPKEYSQNKGMSQNSRSVGNNQYFSYERQYSYTKRKENMVVATCINIDVYLLET